MNEPHDFTRALYPFLHNAPRDASVLDAVVQSTLDKCAESNTLRRELIGEYDDELQCAASAMAERFANGATLFSFGNGGSATDADDAAADCLSPPVPDWQPLPAVSLCAESATVTALTNDVGFEHVFARQLAALGTGRDIALGLSTSGNSANVVAAMTVARRLGMLTLAFCGYDGGVIAREGNVDHCFVARREFVPRIQEGHATLWHALLELTQASRAARAGVSR